MLEKMENVGSSREMDGTEAFVKFVEERSWPIRVGWVVAACVGGWWLVVGGWKR